MIPCRVALKNALLGLTTLFLAGFAAAQSERGTISGTVRDTSGAVIPQVKVTVTNTATNQPVELQTSDSGDFSVVDLRVGSYTVRADKAGFRPAEITGLSVDAAASVRADLSLQIGQSQQVIEVQAAAVQLNSEDSKTTVTINQKLVDTLPLLVGGAVRSPFDLAALTPEAKTLAAMPAFHLVADRPRVMERRSTVSRSQLRERSRRAGSPRTLLPWKQSRSLRSIPTASKRNTGMPAAV